MHGAMDGEHYVKDTRVLGWSGVSGAEEALVRRCVEGDDLACAELVGQHERMVYQLARTLLGDHDDALDVSQEVFLRVFRTLHRFRGQSSLKTWIYRIVVNQSRNKLRWWTRRRRALQVSLEEHVAIHGEPAGQALSAPDRILGRKELADRVWWALECLPFDQRTAVILREIEGLSYQEIAYSLGVLVGTVKSRLARAREGLRVALRNER